MVNFIEHGCIYLLQTVDQWQPADDIWGSLAYVACHKKTLFRIRVRFCGICHNTRQSLYQWNNNPVHHIADLSNLVFSLKNELMLKKISEAKNWWCSNFYTCLTQEKETKTQTMQNIWYDALSNLSHRSETVRMIINSFSLAKCC